MLLLLHGAIGDQTQFEALRSRLSVDDTHAIDFEGHGARAMNARDFRIEHFADNVSDWLDVHASEPVDIFGYSMGGYVALYLAATQPYRVRSVFTLGTKLKWSPEIAVAACGQLDPDKISHKLPAFAANLARRHHETGWRRVLEQTCMALRVLGESPLLTDAMLLRLSCPVRLAVGDRDTTLSVEEVRDAARVVPGGEYEVLPGTSHAFDRVPLERLVWTLQQFLKTTEVSARA